MQDVCLAALYVSTKMNDTLKKPKDILTASYAIRFPEKALKSKTLVREVDVDPQVRQTALLHSGKFNESARSDPRIRQRLLAIERLILETICFNFTSKMPFPFAIKFGRYFNGSSLLPARHLLPSYSLSLSVLGLLTIFAWLLTFDAYRAYPPL